MAEQNGAAAQTEPALEISTLRRTFVRESGAVVRAVDDVSLTVEQGEFVVLLGPSGCGKTTLLRCIAGLETPDQGVIRTFGETVYSQADGVAVPVERRALGMVFQSYALWPHLTAAENVAYPVRFGRRGASASRVGRRAGREMALAALARVGVDQVADQYPAQMSGGQQQRVALARAIVDGRRLILFDEPLSNVDARERERLRIELAAMHRDLGFTAVYVTHDQVEALELADRVVVMREGVVEQSGRPQEVYLESRSRYVASFLGSTNELAAEVVAVDERGVVVKAADVEWVIDDAPADVAPGTTGVLVVRPEHLVMNTDRVTNTEGDRPGLPAVVVASSFLGAYGESVVELDAGAQLMIRTSVSGLPTAGTKVWVTTSGPAKFFT